MVPNFLAEALAHQLPNYTPGLKIYFEYTLVSFNTMTYSGTKLTEHLTYTNDAMLFWVIAIAVK